MILFFNSTLRKPPKPEEHKEYGSTVNGFNSRSEKERLRKMGLFMDCCLLGLEAVFNIWSGQTCELPVSKLVLITNRKLYMSFRLVPKSVTLNDLERRNDPYFALFHRIPVRCRRKTIIRPTSVSKSTFDNL